MAASKRTDKQIEEDRTLIARWLIQNISYREMIKKLAAHNEQAGKDYTITSTSQIAYDVKAILKEWQDERKDIIDLVVDRELKKLDIIEEEMWSAWEKSKGGKRTTKIDGGNVAGGAVGGGKIKERSIEDTFGDTRFMDKILQCMDRRKDLLGYAAPKKVEFSGSVGVGMTPMAEEDIDKEKQRMLKNLKKVDKANGGD